MYKKYIPFLLAGSLAYSSCNAQNKNNKTVAVAFYNMENLFDTEDDANKFDEEFTPTGDYHYTADIYKRKLENIAYVLKQLAAGNTTEGPAIIGVAEVENSRVLSDLALQPDIKQRGYKHILFEGPDPRGIDVGLLYNPKLFKILQAYPVTVPLNGFGRKSSTRDVLKVKGILAGDTVYILVNHWPSRREGEQETEEKRGIAAHTNRLIIDTIRRHSPDARIIVMGDMNDNPTDKSIVYGLGTSGNKSQVKAGELFNPWRLLYESGQGTEGSPHHRDLFDQIIISPAFTKPVAGRLNYCEAEIFDRPFLITRSGRFKGFPYRSFGGKKWINGYSDHLPVILYFNK